MDDFEVKGLPETHGHGIPVRDLGMMESYNNELFRLLEQAILRNQVADLGGIVDEITPYLETAEERLDVDKMKNGRQVLSLGGIESMLRLIDRLSSTEKSMQSYLAVLNQYKYLDTCIRIVFEEGMVSGKELRNRLKIEEKHRSSLTNFFGRIAEYRIFSISKIGNTNYYSLTSKGKELWDYIASRQKSNINDATSQIILLLDAMTGEMKKVRPNPAKVIYAMMKDGKTWNGNRDLLDYKIAMCFQSRDKLCNKLNMMFYDYIDNEETISYIQKYQVTKMEWKKEAKKSRGISSDFEEWEND